MRNKGAARVLDRLNRQHRANPFFPSSHDLRVAPALILQQNETLGPDRIGPVPHGPSRNRQEVTVPNQIVPGEFCGGSVDCLDPVFFSFELM